MSVAPILEPEAQLEGGRPWTAEQWRAEVAKMREVYKAPVADADVPSIVAYLASGRRTPPATGIRR